MCLGHSDQKNVNDQGRPHCRQRRMRVTDAPSYINQLLNNLSCEDGHDHHGRLGNHDAPKDYVVNSDTMSIAPMRPGTPGTVKCWR